MSDPIPIALVVEDELSETVARVLLTPHRFAISVPYSRGGNAYIKRNIRGFNNAAKGTPHLVLTDLDSTDCPPTLISEWLAVPVAPNMLFRVAVREIEAWVLADRDRIAGFLGISGAHSTETPDDLPDPKRHLVNLARKSSRRDIRDDLVPRANSTAQVGRNYNARMSEFVQNHWRPRVAAKRSPSLARTIRAINAFRPQWK